MKDMHLVPIVFSASGVNALAGVLLAMQTSENFDTKSYVSVRFGFVGSRRFWIFFKFFSAISAMRESFHR